MVKLLVPAPLEGEFAADGRFQGQESETVGDFREALRLLEEQPESAVFLGGGREVLEGAAYRSVVRAFSPLRQPVLVLAGDGRLIWANEQAAEEGLSLEAAPGGDISGILDESTKHSFLKALARSAAEGVLTRAVVKKADARYEVSIIPAGEGEVSLAAAVFSRRDDDAALYERVERLTDIAVSLFPEDPEMLVRMPGPERLDFIKGLIEKTVQRTFEYDDFILRTIDEKSGDLEVILARSGTGAKLSKRTLRVGTEGGSVAGYVAATGRPYLVDDAETEPRWIGDLEGIHSVVVVPLRLGSKVIGTFAVEKKERFAFDYYDLMLATMFADYITAALDMADLVGLGQSVVVEQVAASVVEEVADHLKNINESVSRLRGLNIGDSIAVTSRLESIRTSVSTIEESILKGARKVGAAVGPPKVPADETLAGKRILVADDEPSILQSLGDILRSSGCEVEFAHDGSEAVEMASSRQYDLVVSDIKMPKMTGYEVYSSIKARFPDTSVILMTAYGYDPTHSIVRARQEGLEAVLYKPFRAETLKKALKQALGKKETGT